MAPITGNRNLMGTHHSAAAPRCLDSRNAIRARGRFGLALVLAAVLTLGIQVSGAQAEELPTTPGYPERVLQWTVQPGETCDSLAKALYGSVKHVPLLLRYNFLTCGPGETLVEGSTLVVPAAVVELPAARVESLHPDVRARAGGSPWQAAASGMPLFRNHAVNTLADARANILFVDRSRISLNEHTLVVIYGSAGDSSVSSQAPPAVELESGEVQAGLLALRGNRQAKVALKTGGEVSARSSDTVVRSSANGTTVSVFDGDADVQSAGKSVKVPTNFGTKFAPKKPPQAPQPLPPAPLWQAPSSEGLVVQPSDGGSIVAHWGVVERATAYRVELARDSGFTELLVRDEAAADVLAFKATGLPSGSYYLRVRAIDGDGLLGIAAEPRVIQLVVANFGFSKGAIRSHLIETSPYDILELSSPPGLELAMDDGPFGRPPAQIDLRKLAPKKLRLRVSKDATPETFELRYRALAVEVDWPEAGAAAREAHVVVSPVSSQQEALRIEPRLRVLVGSVWSELMLAPGVAPGEWRASVPGEMAAPSRVAVVDAQGRMLASVVPESSPRPALSPSIPQRYSRGSCAPVYSPDTWTSVAWWAPTACDAASLSLGIAHANGPNAVNGALRVSGTWGPVSLEGLLATEDLAGKRPLDDAAWVGLRWRAWGYDGRWSFGPAASLALPPTAGSAPLRAQAGLSLAWQSDRFAWISNLGGRAPLKSDAGRLDAPEGQAFLLSGGTWNALDWLMAHAVVDAHLVRDGEQRRLEPRGGLSLGLETAAAVFVAVGARFSPFEELGGGSVCSKASLGVRGW